MWADTFGNFIECRRTLSVLFALLRTKIKSSNFCLMSSSSPFVDRFIIFSVLSSPIWYVAIKDKEHHSHRLQTMGCPTRCILLVTLTVGRTEGVELCLRRAVHCRSYARIARCIHLRIRSVSIVYVACILTVTLHLFSYCKCTEDWISINIVHFVYRSGYNTVDAFNKLQIQIKVLGKFTTLYSHGILQGVKLVLSVRGWKTGSRDPKVILSVGHVASYDVDNLRRGKVRWLCEILHWSSQTTCLTSKSER